eukprot:CAMPEP_0172201004 /NCGR_PEP_ID=MMETSP1050-20130122/29706_1 /TAXON_ID=233186 /ORGANISM="Cryptomonas curvata, Strain CCAP979/52" /LENGTH=67 /DNA_ID=CAMNT_0012878497 /DNA_START=122 /DNA_END=322 /DNA_ORIENTATION=+
MQYDSHRGSRYSPPPKGHSRSPDVSAIWKKDVIRRKVHLASQISGEEEWRLLFRRFDSNQDGILELC